MAQEEMVFTGDASPLEDEIKKLVRANQELEKQMARQSKQGLEQQNQMREALKQTQEKIKALTEEQKKHGKETDKGSEGVKALAQGLAIEIGRKGVEALKKLVEAQSEYNKELAKQGQIQDEVMRKAQKAFAMPSEAEFGPLRKQIFQGAIKSGATEENAVDTARSLKRAGLSAGDATGDILTEVLKTSQATDTSGSEIAEAIAKELKSEGKKFNLENVKKLTAVIGGTKTMEFDPVNVMKELRPHGDLLTKSGVGGQERMAAMFAMTEGGGKDAGTAAQSLGKISEHLATLKDDSKRFEAVSKVANALGENANKFADSLNPQKVWLEQSVANLGSAMDKLNPEAQLAFIKEVMGEKQMEGLTSLLANRQMFFAQMKSAADPNKLQAKWQASKIGPAAQANVIKLQKDLDLWQERQNKAYAHNYIEAYIAQLEKANVNALSIGTARKVLETVGGDSVHAAEKVAQGLDLTRGGAHYAADAMNVYKSGLMNDTLVKPKEGAPLEAAGPLVPKGGGLAVNFRSKEDEIKDQLDEARQKQKELQAEKESDKIKILEQREAQGRHLKFSKHDERTLHDKFDLREQQLERLIKQLEIANSKDKREKRQSAND